MDILHVVRIIFYLSKSNNVITMLKSLDNLILPILPLLKPYLLFYPRLIPTSSSRVRKVKQITADEQEMAKLYAELIKK